MDVQSDNIYSTVKTMTPVELKKLEHILDEFDHDTSLAAIDEDAAGRKTLLFRNPSGGVVFYTGLIPWLEHSCHLEITSDLSCDPIDLEVDPHILKGVTLRDYQVFAIQKMLKAHRGIVQMATGAGKTVVAGALLAHLFRDNLVESAFILVPTVFLMEQMYTNFKKWGLPAQMYRKQKKLREDLPIIISVVDSAFNALAHESPVRHLFLNAEVLLMDEAHHAKANRWLNLTKRSRARFRWGLTATAHDDPRSFCYADLLLYGLLGPVILEISSKDLRERGLLAHPIVTMIRYTSGEIPVYSWPLVYDIGIQKSHRRNSLIVSLAQACFLGQNKTLIFVGRKEHGHQLAYNLVEKDVDVLFVHGGKQVFRYKKSGGYTREIWNIEEIAEYIETRDRLVVIATQIFDEGVDFPAVNVLIVGTGMKKYRRTVQRAGRGMRPKENDNFVYIFDFYDDSHRFLEDQSKYRLFTYKLEEFEIAETIASTETKMGLHFHLRFDAYQRKHLPKELCVKDRSES